MKLEIVILDDDGSELGRCDNIHEAEELMDRIEAERWETEQV